GPYQYCQSSTTTASRIRLKPATFWLFGRSRISSSTAAILLFHSRGGPIGGGMLLRRLRELDLPADDELLQLGALLVDLARLLEVDSAEEGHRAEPSEKVGDGLLVHPQAGELELAARLGELCEPELVRRRGREIGEDAQGADLLRLELADDAEL